MWSDNDIDTAFQRLNPPEPTPTSFPLDAWLRLETQLDKALIEREVRRKLWRHFAAEVAVVALVALGWLLWPGRPAAPTGRATAPGANRVATPLATSPTPGPKSPLLGQARPAAQAATKTLAGSGTGIAPADATPASPADAAARPARPITRAATTVASPLVAGATPTARRRQTRQGVQTAEKLLAYQSTRADGAAPALRKTRPLAEGRATSPTRQATAASSMAAPVIKAESQSVGTGETGGAPITFATAAPRQLDQPFADQSRPLSGPGTPPMRWPRCRG
ncbi:MAG: hypothetical protein NVS3B25_17730 [Hymenobacter sp.]